MPKVPNDKDLYLVVNNTNQKSATFDVEFSVLGGLMLDNNTYIFVADILDEIDFYYTEHQLIYRGIKALSEQKNPCDVVILSEWLESHGKLEVTGGLPYLSKLIKHTPSAANVLTYARLVRKFSLQRQLDKAYQEQRPASIIQHLENTLNEMLNPRIKSSSFNNLKTREKRPVDWIVKGILPVGLSLLASKPKVGKSWLALQLATCVSAGGKLFGRDDFQSSVGEVIYLALEDNFSRLRTRCEMQESYPAGVYYTKDEGYPKIGDGFEQQLRKDLEALSNPKLVVVDTLGKVLPSRQNVSYQEDYQLTEMLQKIHILYPGIAVLLVHHQRKAPSEDNTDTLIGTTGLSGGVDNLLFLKRESGKAVLSITGKDVDEQNLMLQFDKVRGTWQCLGNAEEWHLSESRKQILDAIHKYNAETRSEIEQLVEINGGYLRRLLQRMVKEGSLAIGGKKGREYRYLLIQGK